MPGKAGEGLGGGSRSAKGTERSQASELQEICPRRQATLPLRTLALLGEP